VEKEKENGGKISKNQNNIEILYMKLKKTSRILKERILVY
jgi:hypothetical protein